MDDSRRKWFSRLPALAAAIATSGYAKPDASLPSRTYRFKDLAVHPNGGNASRPVLQGETHSGSFIEVHETDLAPGGMPHPPHHHVHEEMFLIREGSLEVTIAGKTTSLGPGGVAYVASNDEHGVRNPGPAHAQYYVLALGKDQ